MAAFSSARSMTCESVHPLQLGVLAFELAQPLHIGHRRPGIAYLLRHLKNVVLLMPCRRSRSATGTLEQIPLLRPKKSALDAVGVARKRCWRSAWVLDLDIRAYFDTIPHGLLLKAVRAHTDCAWVLLYIERWLTAPVQMADGTLAPREKGTPQGSVVSPLLANLFLHYAFDRWMAQHHPDIPFERFADDILCHCVSEAQARRLQRVLAQRFATCGLELHPQKTKVVYCRDDDRRGHALHETFDFLGYTFRARRPKNRWGKYFVNFSPAVSNAAAKRMRREIRAWQLGCRVDKRIDDLARMFNPIIRGWLTYYGRYYPSGLYPTLQYLDRRLARWAEGKYKRLRRHRRRSEHRIRAIAACDPGLFAHWRLFENPDDLTLRELRTSDFLMTAPLAGSSLPSSVYRGGGGKLTLAFPDRPDSSSKMVV